MSEQQLTPDEIRKLLEGHEDVLTGLVKTEETFLRHVACPKCGGFAHSAKVNPDNPFTPGEALPNKVLTCACGTEFDPYTRFIRRVPIGESD